jgi:hypothetical protein
MNMKKTTYCAGIRTVVLGAAVVMITATAAQAQATRTWVSGVGNDANPCSRTAPCKTFAGAISKTAAGGFIDVLDPGGFGAVTITKAITIDGSGGSIAGVLAAGTNGIIINITTGVSIVHLRNLSIESPSAGTQGTNGVEVISAGEVHIDHCAIGSFTTTAVNFHPTTGFLFVTDTIIWNNAANGIVVSKGRATIENLHANKNGSGVVVNGDAIATVRNSYAGGNAIGFSAVVNPAAVLNLESCVVTNNTNGINAANGATVRVGNTTIVSNGVGGLVNDGASFIVSLQGNSLVGNPTPGAFTSTVIKQ